MLWEYILLLIFPTYDPHVSVFGIAYLFDLFISDYSWDDLIGL